MRLRRFLPTAAGALPAHVSSAAESASRAPKEDTVEMLPFVVATDKDTRLNLRYNGFWSAAKCTMRPVSRSVG